MKVSKFFRIVSLTLLPAASLQPANTIGQDTSAQARILVQQALGSLTDVMTRDITAPPVAARTYVYSMIAFYEAARFGEPSCPSFQGRLNGLSDSLPVPDSACFWLVAGAAAFHKTASGIIFSKDMFERLYDSVYREIRSIYLRPGTEEEFGRSVRFGERMGSAILAWSRGDGYGYTRTLTRFTPGKAPGDWQQTGPEYMEAVEPHWDLIRTMTMTKAHQFAIPDPAPFKSPEFVKEYMEVYNTTKNNTPDQTASALFWDCNPYAVQTVGHLMYSIKKISPGGHWMGIASIATNLHHDDLVHTLYTYSLVAMATFDGFISAWNEKYRTNYLRPITAIQELYAPTWEPVLQTPPFPEYPSAHSVISMASAVVLTALYGEQFAYSDNVEVSFGLPVRHFRSFVQAANEAGMSRLYGGIHFREAVVNGLTLGTNVGGQIVRKLNVTALP